MPVAENIFVVFFDLGLNLFFEGLQGLDSVGALLETLLLQKLIPKVRLSSSILTPREKKECLQFFEGMRVHELRGARVEFAVFKEEDISYEFVVGVCLHLLVGGHQVKPALDGQAPILSKMHVCWLRPQSQCALHVQKRVAACGNRVSVVHLLHKDIQEACFLLFFLQLELSATPKTSWVRSVHEGVAVCTVLQEQAYLKRERI